MENLQELIRLFYFNLPPEQQSRIISSLIIILILVIFRFIAVRILYQRYKTSTRAFYNGRKTIQYVTVALGFILIGRMWITGIQSLVTYLGLVSAGIAIALQDLLVNLAGWLFIISRRPFGMGDRIEVDSILGDVVDIRLFQFSMLEVGGGRLAGEQSTGRLVHMPNGIVFRQPVINTHQGLPYIWNEIPVLITFESDWRKAKGILTNIVDRLAPDVSEAAKRYVRRVEKRFVINYGNVKPVVYTAVVDSGVQLTLRYMVSPRRRRSSEQTMWEAILAAFERHDDIDFAYPTQREFIHFQEGKHKRTRPLEDSPTIVARPVEWSEGRSTKKDDDTI